MHTPSSLSVFPNDTIPRKYRCSQSLSHEECNSVCLAKVFCQSPGQVCFRREEIDSDTLPAWFCRDLRVASTQSPGASAPVLRPPPPIHAIGSVARKRLQKRESDHVNSQQPGAALSSVATACHMWLLKFQLITVQGDYSSALQLLEPLFKWPTSHV